MNMLLKIIFLLTLQLVMLTGVRAAAPLPVFHVDARGKTGGEIGTHLGNLIIQKFPDISKKIDGTLNGFVGQDTFNYYALRIKPLVSNIEPRYVQEVQGLADLLVDSSRDELGDGLLSMNELWFFQLMTDMARPYSCTGFGVFTPCSAEDGPIVGRNVDWPNNEDLRSIQAITVYRYDDKTLVNIGAAGYTPVVSGFNSNGLFAAHLDSPMKLPYPDSLAHKRSAVFDIRKALETTSTNMSAADLLSGPVYPFSHNVLLADVRDVIALEHPVGETAKIRTAGSPLRIDISWHSPCEIAVINFFALRGFSNIPELVPKWRRLETLADKFNATHKAGVRDVTKIMSDKKNYPDSIFNPSTLQSMVFVPSKNKLFLYALPPVLGAKAEFPRFREVTGLLPPDEVSSGPENKNILAVAIFILVLTVAILGVLYYNWEKKIKNRLN